MQWSETVSKFADYLYTKGSSEHTIRSYRSDLRQFCQWAENELGEVPPVDEVTESQLESFMHHERSRGLAQQTLKRRVSSLKAFYKWAYRKDIVEDNPASELPSPTVHYVPEYCPSAEEVQDILDNCYDPVAWAVMGCLFHTGLRVGELCSLEVGDVQLDRALVVVRHGKGNKRRRVPLNDSALRILQKYWHDIRPHVNSDRFFATRTGQLSPGYAGKLIRQERERQGIERPLSAHALRHAFATTLHGKGVDWKTLQSLLGHASLNVLRIYVHLSRDRLAEAVNLLD